jgi:hypothetical protein
MLNVNVAVAQYEGHDSSDDGKHTR